MYTYTHTHTHTYHEWPHTELGSASHLINLKSFQPKAHRAPAENSAETHATKNSGVNSDQSIADKKLKQNKQGNVQPKLEPRSAAFEALLHGSWHRVEIVGENAATGELLVRPAGCHAALQGAGLNHSDIKDTFVSTKHVRNPSKAFSRSSAPGEAGMRVLAVAQRGEGQTCTLVDGRIVDRRARERDITRGVNKSAVSGGNSFWGWDYKVLFENGSVEGLEQWLSPQHVLGDMSLSLSVFILYIRMCVLYESL
jgi:hypothetical protein